MGEERDQLTEEEFWATINRVVERFNKKPEGWQKLGLRSLGYNYENRKERVKLLKEWNGVQ